MKPLYLKDRKITVSYGLEDKYIKPGPPPEGRGTATPLSLEQCLLCIYNHLQHGNVPLLAYSQLQIKTYKLHLNFGTFIKLKSYKIQACDQIGMDLNCLIVNTKNCKG